MAQYFNIIISAMNHQQAWLIRPRSKNKDQTQLLQLFLKRRLIAVDVPPFTIKDRDSISGMSQDEIRSLLSKAAPELPKKELTNFTDYLDAIANRMQTGDLVILVSTRSPKIHLGKISSDYNANLVFPRYHDTPKDAFTSLNHVRYVAWEREVPRDELTQELRKALRVPKSVADFSSHYEELDALIQGQDYVPQQEDIAVSYRLRPDYTIQFNYPVRYELCRSRKTECVFQDSLFRTYLTEADAHRVGPIQT